jgi:hypothetical protein
VTLGSSANEAIRGLSAQPMLLLIAILNVTMVGGLIYVARSQQEERAVLTAQIFANCKGGP